MKLRLKADGPVHGRVRAVLVLADATQKLDLLQGGEERARLSRSLCMGRVDDGGHRAACAAQNVDGREAAGRRELVAEHDMSVEERLAFVNDRVGLHVALRKHGVEGGDGAAFADAGALEQFRQHCEHGWGKPRRPGGSPMARPISRAARATRVTLSINSRTL